MLYFSEIRILVIQQNYEIGNQNNINVSGNLSFKIKNSKKYWINPKLPPNCLQLIYLYGNYCFKMDTNFVNGLKL